MLDPRPTLSENIWLEYYMKTEYFFLLYAFILLRSKRTYISGFPEKSFMLKNEFHANPKTILSKKISHSPILGTHCSAQRGYILSKAEEILFSWDTREQLQRP